MASRPKTAEKISSASFAAGAVQTTARAGSGGVQTGDSRLWSWPACNCGLSHRSAPYPRLVRKARGVLPLRHQEPFRPAPLAERTPRSSLARPLPRVWSLPRRNIARWCGNNVNRASRFYGFDTFKGLLEPSRLCWREVPAGSFSAGGSPHDIRILESVRSKGFSTHAARVPRGDGLEPPSAGISSRCRPVHLEPLRADFHSLPPACWHRRDLRRVRPWLRRGKGGPSVFERLSGELQTSRSAGVRGSGRYRSPGRRPERRSYGVEPDEQPLAPPCRARDPDASRSPGDLLSQGQTDAASTRCTLLRRLRAKS